MPDAERQRLQRQGRFHAALRRNHILMQNTDLLPDFETQCRERLFADPADSPTRLELAWILLLRAYHCASEAEICAMRSATQEPEWPLLKESLMQAAVAALLSPEAGARRDAARIADRARTLGAGELVEQTARETQAMQRHLTAAVKKKAT